MTSEVHKYVESSLEKEKNLFNAEVISFPNEPKIEKDEKLKSNSSGIWNINDKSNDDQLKAVTGICMMFGVLIIMGLYSNLT